MSCYNWSGTVPGGGASYFAISVAQAGPVTFKWSMKAAVGTLSNTGFAWEVVNGSTGALVVGGANAGASGSFTYTLPAGVYYVWLYNHITGGTIAISGTFTTSGACSSVPPSCPAYCPAHNWCGAASGYKCTPCTPACASPCVCGPHANTCTCPPPKCPTCATCHVCTDPVLGCVPMLCPTGTHCVNNVCVSDSVPPPPASSSSLVPVLAIGGGLAGVLWLANRHSERSGQPRRRDHSRVMRRR